MKWQNRSDGKVSWMPARLWRAGCVFALAFFALGLAPAACVWAGPIHEKQNARLSLSRAPAVEKASATSVFPKVQYPDMPILVSPADGVSDVSTTTPLEVMSSDAAEDPQDIHFYGREAGGGSDGDFTLVALPDTQNYASYYPSVLTSQLQWIVDKEAEENIVFVTHLGDLVNTATSLTEYDRVEDAISLLDRTDIPYSIGPGNHDIPDTNFNLYFGVDRFWGASWYGGYYGDNNDNSYSLFSVDGMDFILINLEYEPDGDVLDWAGGLLKTYAGRRAIVASHEILNLDDSWAYGDIFAALQDNPNLFLMLCAHNHSEDDGAGFRSDTASDEHVIYTLLSDYQDFPEGGYGYLRLIRFSPANDKIYVSTYSPYHEVFLITAGNTLALDYDMVSSAPFELLGTSADVQPGAVASYLWEGLSANTTYEWYVTAGNAPQSTFSPAWRFTTGSSTNQGPAILEGSSVSVEMSEDGKPAPFDLTLHASDLDPGDVLTWSITSPAGHGIASISGQGLAGAVAYSPEPDFNGSDQFTVWVADGDDAGDSISVNVTVDPVNDAPVLAAIADKIIPQASTLTFTAGATDPDLPADALTYSLVDAPPGAEIDPASGKFTWTAPAVAGRVSYAITVRVSDAGTLSLWDEEKFFVTVTGDWSVFIPLAFGLG